MPSRARHRGAPRAGLGLKIAALGGLLFLHLPLALIFLYAFTTEDKSYQFPPPGLTLKWFGIAWGRDDIWSALSLSVISSNMPSRTKVAKRGLSIKPVSGGVPAATMDKILSL